MKKILTILLFVIVLFALTACGNPNGKEPSGNNNEMPQKENTEVNNSEEKKQPEEINKPEEQEKVPEEKIDDDIYIDDDEIIERDDEDNVPTEEGTVVVKEVINCDGCVYAYFSDEGDKAKRIGSTLSPSEYTTDINNLKTMGGKQRHNFFGLVLSGNTISKAYACVLKDKIIYCIQGSTNGAYHSSNIAILNKIFASGKCKTISAGHTYTCTDGNYNGDTITTGYTSLHYETSCTIYGADANTGKLICH